MSVLRLGSAWLRHAQDVPTNQRPSFMDTMKRDRKRVLYIASHAAEVQQVETYLGEKFTKAIPQEDGKWASESGPSPIKIQRLDHSAIEVKDVALSIKFYTEVLGFEQLARPGFPFGGAWLKAGGLILHLIEQDPSVEKNQKYDEEGASHNPEPWHIRRSEHKAFQVESLDKTEAALSKLGVEYHKFNVPGTNAAQIFFFDPDRNGIELGEGYAEIAASLQKPK